MPQDLCVGLTVTQLPETDLDHLLRLSQAQVDPGQIGVVVRPRHHGERVGRVDLQQLAQRQRVLAPPLVRDRHVALRGQTGRHLTKLRQDPHCRLRVHDRVVVPCQGVLDLRQSDLRVRHPADVGGRLVQRQRPLRIQASLLAVALDQEQRRDVVQRIALLDGRPRALGDRKRLEEVRLRLLIVPEPLVPDAEIVEHLRFSALEADTARELERTLGDRDRASGVGSAQRPSLRVECHDLGRVGERLERACGPQCRVRRADLRLRGHWREQHRGDERREQETGGRRRH